MRIIVPFVVSILFILLFVYASGSKLKEFADFQTQLGQSPLLGAFAEPISYGVIIIELGISLLLAIEKTRKAGLYLAFTLMVMFTGYIIIILNFTAFTPCSCGGVLESLGWTEHLIFNIVFVLLAAWAIVLMEEKPLKKTIFRLVLLAILGSLAITVIFLSSEKEIKQNNAFQRQYIPHGLEKVGEYNLPSNAY